MPTAIITASILSILLIFSGLLTGNDWMIDTGNAIAAITVLAIIAFIL